MRLKLAFLVRRKIRRWSRGKGPLNKEQLEYLDKAVLNEYYNGSRLKWYFDQEKNNEQKKMEKRT